MPTFQSEHNYDSCHPLPTAILSSPLKENSYGLVGQLASWLTKNQTWTSPVSLPQIKSHTLPIIQQAQDYQSIKDSNDYKQCGKCIGAIVARIYRNI